MYARLCVCIYIYIWQVRCNGMGDGSKIVECLNSSGGIFCNVGVTVKSTAVGVDCWCGVYVSYTVNVNCWYKVEWWCM